MFRGTRSRLENCGGWILGRSVGSKILLLLDLILEAT